MLKGGTPDISLDYTQKNIYQGCYVGSCPLYDVELCGFTGSATSHRISCDVHTLRGFIQQQRLLPDIFLWILAVPFHTSRDVVRFKGRKAASYRIVHNETSKQMGGCRFHQHKLRRFQQHRIGVYQESGWRNNWGNIMFLGEKLVDRYIPTTSHYTYPGLFW